MVLITSLYALCGVAYIVIGVKTLANDPKEKLNRVFLFMSLCLAYWSILFAFKNASTNIGAVVELHRYTTFAWSGIHALLLHSILLLTKRGDFFKKRPLAWLFYTPVIISIYLYFFQPPTAVDFHRSTLGWIHVVATDRGFLWTYFFNTYYISYMAGAIFLLSRWYLTTPVIRYKKQARLVLITLLITILGGGFIDLVLPSLGYDQLPQIGVITVIIPIIGIAIGIKRYRLMDLNPENIAVEVLKIMEDGIVIVNMDGQVTDINSGGLRLLGYEKEQILGKPIRNIFYDSIDLATLVGCSSYEAVLLKDDGSRLPVLLSSSVLRDRWGEILGIVGIFQNMSEIESIQNKLKESYDDLEQKIIDRTIDLKRTNEELELEIENRTLMEAEIKNLAYFDHLTGLPNKRLFLDRIDQTMKASKRKGTAFGVMFIDLDSFKRINDTMGHNKGDELLKMVARRISNLLREEDTVSRVGGDEFLILIEDLSADYSMEIIASKVLNLFKSPFIIDQHELFITTSIGGAIYPIDGLDDETLIKNADIAMYKAKEKGKNTFELCTHFIKNSVVEEMNLTNSLYGAIDRNEFELYYQPQINVTTEKIIGIEALIRWHNKDLGLVNPADFIYIAEKTGLIIPIGEWVIHTACKQKKMWQKQGVLDVPVSVNLSVNQFHNRGIVQTIQEVVASYSIRPGDLEIEITENIIMKETQYIIEALTEMKKLGITIAIDDFGTEYSSLNYIKQLPVDKIKIDISFVRGIGVNEKDEAIIKVIIMLAKSLGLKVIAEGVETEEQLEFLKAELCDEVQGYYYHKAMSVGQIEKMLMKASIRI